MERGVRGGGGTGGGGGGGAGGRGEARARARRPGIRVIQGERRGGRPLSLQSQLPQTGRASEPLGPRARRPRITRMTTGLRPPTPHPPPHPPSPAQVAEQGLAARQIQSGRWRRPILAGWDPSHPRSAVRQRSAAAALRPGGVSRRTASRRRPGAHAGPPPQPPHRRGPDGHREECESRCGRASRGRRQQCLPPAPPLRRARSSLPAMLVLNGPKQSKESTEPAHGGTQLMPMRRAQVHLCNRQLKEQSSCTSIF